MKESKDKIIYWQRKIILLQEKIIDQQRQLINFLKQEKSIKEKEGGRNRPPSRKRK